MARGVRRLLATIPDLVACEELLAFSGHVSSVVKGGFDVGAVSIASGSNVLQQNVLGSKNL